MAKLRDFLFEYIGVYMIILAIAGACMAMGYWLIKSVVISLSIGLTDDQIWQASLVATLCYVAILAKVRHR